MAKPVLVLQHLNDDGPAYLARWLRGAGHVADLRNSERGDPMPRSIAGYAALAILGGEMGANDDLPGLRRAEELVRDAVAQGVPVLGHCLGGQLIARALGARVQRNPAGPEIGWHRIAVASTSLARERLGTDVAPVVFQWHRDTFELPRDAEPLASSELCANQAFAIGPHLALQFHVEVDARKLLRWTRDEPLAEDARAARRDAVQTAAAMRTGARRWLAAQQAMARHVYADWRRRWRD